MTGSIIALDVGEKRIGVAIASLPGGWTRPLVTLAHTQDIMAAIVNLVQKEQAQAVVVGLPRGLDGQNTAQTTYVKQFVAELNKYIAGPIHWQDEAATSLQAKAELEARGKPYAKEDIDALAATYILEDFLREHNHQGLAV